MRGVCAVKKVLGFLITITLLVSSLSVAVFGVNNNGIFENESNNGSTIAFHLTNSSGTDINAKTGDYTPGEDFYFRINAYVTSELKGCDVVRKINFLDDYEKYDNDATNFMYTETAGTGWQEDPYLADYGFDGYLYRGTKEDDGPLHKYTTSGNHTTYFKVHFNTVGRHIIEYSATCYEKNFRLIQRKYVDIYRDGTFKISTYEEAQQTTAKPTYSVQIDGVPYQSDIQEGGSCTLPGSGYGFFDRKTGKLYPAYFELSNIQENYTFFSVDQVNVSCASGANIRGDGKHGIRFGSIANIKNKGGSDITETVLKSGAIQIGTIIATYDNYTDVFEENLDKEYVDEMDPDNEYHFDVLNPKDDWPTNTSTNKPNYGLCYAGVVNIKESNLKRDFISSAYVRIEYQQYGENTFIDYLDATNQYQTKRSIVGVAKKMKAAGYPGCTAAQIQVLEYYCSLG